MTAFLMDIWRKYRAERGAGEWVTNIEERLGDPIISHLWVK